MTGQAIRSKPACNGGQLPGRKVDEMPVRMPSRRRALLTGELPAAPDLKKEPGPCE